MADESTMRPLCVDLDGTLIATDILFEATARLIKQQPAYAFLLPIWLRKGKAYLKRQVCSRVELDPMTLPYREDVIAFLKKERAAGRQLILATACDMHMAEPIAEYLQLFDLVVASDGINNCRSEGKVQAIRAALGDAGFDYLGDSAADLPIWQQATDAYIVDPRNKALNRLRQIKEPKHVFIGHPHGGVIGGIIKAMRPHQWAKNALLAVPLFMAHQFTDLGKWLLLIVAFITFSMLASAVYIINDIFDLDADRTHPKKKFRPFASGRVSIPTGLAVAGLFLPLAFALACAVMPMAFVEMLGLYLFLTCAYTLLFKRKMIIDVIMLAGLYAHRILSGGAAVDVQTSQWLLAFSMFLFLSLAFAKRLSELMRLKNERDTIARGRGYHVDDLPLVQTLGACSGYMAVLVYIVYFNLSEQADVLYSNHDPLWLIAPVLLYWISRIWVHARRGDLQEDPMVFTFTDRISWVCGWIILILIMLAR